MSNSKNKITAPNGWYWVNVSVSGGVKIVGAELITEATEKSERTFCLWSNSSAMEYELDWKLSENREGWYFKIVKESEVSTFFNY